MGDVAKALYSEDDDDLRFTCPAFGWFNTSLMNGTVARSLVLISPKASHHKVTEKQILPWVLKHVHLKQIA